MEIKINREIRDYHESMFMGLSLRQSVFSVLAILVAVGLYFWLNPILGTETVSWVCILGAAPFAIMGFVSYHGMPAENRSMMLSIDIVPVATDEAVREVERKMLGVETNITNWQRRQNTNNNFSATVPYDMELQRRETKEYMDDLTGRDQRMMLAVLTVIHLADTKEQLDADTDGCSVRYRRWGQHDRGSGYVSDRQCGRSALLVLVRFSR